MKYRISGTSADVNAADEYRVRDTYFLTTGAATDQMSVRVNWPTATVDFDYMNATPVAVGEQKDLTITQAFDFPTAYGAKRNVSELRNTQHEQAAIATRREVLLDAKRTCIALVHANKRSALLAQRHATVLRFPSGPSRTGRS